MQMKWLVTILVAALAFVGYLWLQDDAPPQDEVSQPTSAVPPGANLPPGENPGENPGGNKPTTEPPLAEDAVSEIDPERQAAAEALEREIKTLMVDFDRYRHDAGRRDQIQSEIDDLLAEYNELILPVALTKIKESN